MTVAEFPFVRRLFIELNNGEILEADKYAVKSLVIEQIRSPLIFKTQSTLFDPSNDPEKIKVRVTITFEGESLAIGYSEVPDELLAGANFMLGDGKDDN